VIDRDTRLASTLELGDGMTLDCQGRRLLPTAAGSGSTLADFVPSQPEVAIAILERHGATVRNCVVGTRDERFDFGVLVAGGGGHRVADNQLNVRTYGVKLLAASDNLVENNDLTWTGYGISMLRNADRNVVRGNRLRLVLDDAPLPYMRDDPGMPTKTTGGRDGINVISPVAYHPVATVVVNGRFLQYPTADGVPDECTGPCPGYGRAQDNLIEDNLIWLPGPPPLDNTRIGIIAAMMSSRTVIRGNVIHEGAHGIRMAGNAPAQPVLRPAHCVDAGGVPTDRLCATNDECFIDGIDAVAVGTCPALATDVIDAQARDTLAEDNRLFGPFNDGRPSFRTGIVGGNATVRGIIRRNQIQGTGTEAGIVLATYTLQTGTVTGNRIHGAQYGLLLSRGTAAFFGAHVWGNDIVDSTVAAIGLDSPYPFATELSFDGVGNYWGHDEEPCFRASDSPDFALIHDSHASCRSLAH